MRISILVCLVCPAAGAEAVAERKPPGAVRKLVFAASSKEAAGEYAAAREILERGLAESPDSPYLVSALGPVQQDMGDYRLAERSYRRVLNAWDPESESILRIRVVNNLATLYLETGQLSRANDLCQHIEEVPREEFERNPADAGMVLNTLATLRHQQGRDADAEQMYRETAKWWRRAGGDRTVRLAEVNMNLGKMYFDAKRFEEAASILEQVVADMQDQLGQDHPSLIRPLYNLAFTEYEWGNAGRAEPHAQRAATIAVEKLGTNHPVTAMTMVLQAKALRRLWRKQDARPLEKRANTILRESSERNLAGYTVDVGTLETAGE